MVGSCLCLLSFLHHSHTQDVSSFSFPFPHHILSQWSSSFFLTHAMPSKAAVYCGWATGSSNKTGFGLASHPSSVPITFSAGVNTEHHPDLARALCPYIRAQKFYPLGVLKRSSCYHLLAGRFCFWNSLWGMFRQKGFLEKAWEDPPLIWIAMQLWANHEGCLVSVTLKEK